MLMTFFRVLHQSKKSKARIGEIKTDHGMIKTPAFVPVATKGTLKGLTPEEIKEIGIQVAFVNSYHLVDHPGADLIAKAGGIHNYSKLSIPLMSDSGGFQVFSLNKNQRKEILNSKLEIRNKSEDLNSKLKNKRESKQSQRDRLLIKVSDEGVLFRSLYDGSIHEFTPEKSIKHQKKIGADLIMAFDECVSYGTNHKKTKEAMERTHRWLQRCIKEFNKKSKSQYPNPKQLPNSNNQNRTDKKNLKNCKIGNWNLSENWKLTFENYLYGIIQGGTFKDLRKESAQFVCSQEVDGIAVGGVAVGEGKEEMRKQIEWISPYLPKDKPTHLLGIGHTDDIFDAVARGIDTFDCVEPTRLARMGVIMKHETCNMKHKNTKEDTDINRLQYKKDLTPVDEDCECYVCKNFTKSYLHHLFKQKELLGYTLASYHNLWVMERFMEKVRKEIEEGIL